MSLQCKLILLHSPETSLLSMSCLCAVATSSGANVIMKFAWVGSPLLEIAGQSSAPAATLAQLKSRNSVHRLIFIRISQIHKPPVANMARLQTSPPSSPRLLPSALLSTTALSSPSSRLCLARPTSAPSRPTPRRSSSSPRRLPVPPPPGAPRLSALVSSRTVSPLSSTLPVLCPTRAPPTSAVSSLLPLLLPV